MPVRIDYRQITFGQPELLWLLLVPALLLVLWSWRLVRRRVLANSLQRTRMVPVRERFAPLGDLPFWLCLILSSALLIVALARPHGPNPRHCPHAGQRTQVNDSHDKYANQEVSYLLQKLKKYRGIIILSANSKSGLRQIFITIVDWFLLFRKQI